MHAGGVLVVGDGPAGCAAAISAAKAGCRVTMVGIGRSRAVPEFASSAALRLLDSIAPEVAARADVWLAEGGPGDTGRALDRARFDTGLREATVRAGVDYRRMPAAMLRPRVDGHRMVGVEGLSDSGMDADALAVIDATGVNGWLRRSVGLAEVVDSRPWWLQRGAGVLDGGRARHPATHFAIGPDGWLWRHAIPHGCIWTALRSSRDTTLAWPDDMQPVGRIWRECRRWRHLRQPAGAGFFVCGDAAAISILRREMACVLRWSRAPVPARWRLAWCVGRSAAAWRRRYMRTGCCKPIRPVGQHWLVSTQPRICPCDSGFRD
ncbi:FAD-dependent oxidoreductase [Cupriavidus sp. EM10]|uniref:FAD-dependent oxidoreductase n=1 Tax=Cupriavidus sp. EM10 TaxID=2839983 RepID=UPI001BFFF6D9|nr:FAD-dependent oxidoreductase [Cupriavidus sp. EM10]QWE96537.1 FAD-dependent oxidoreductase [Cupriavidus sp. EM10]